MITSKVNNFLRIVFFISFLLTANEFYYCQKAKIEKIIDSNLFELSDGTLIKIANLDVPNINHPNLDLRKVGREAFEYARQIFLKRSYELTYPNPVKADTSYKLVYLIKEYPLELKDYTQTYLKNGYGRYIINTDTLRESKYILAENEARVDKKGIWQYNFSNSDTLDRGFLGEGLITEEIVDSITNSSMMSSIFSGLSSEERVLLEIVAAPVIGIPFAFLGGLAGAGLGRILGAESWANLGFAVIGAYLGYTFGNATGVYIVARNGEKEVTFGETFLASASGAAIGAAIYLSMDSFKNEYFAYSPLVLPGLFAIIYSNIIADDKLGNNNNSEYASYKLIKNNFGLSHKDLYNSKKLFDMEIFRIHF